MHATKTVPALLALSALAACATPAPVSTSVADAGAPAPVANYDWHLHQEPGEDTLAYGLANSDELKLQLVCRTGSGRLELAAIADKPMRELYLESGGDTERYPARSEAAGINDGEYVSADAQTKDPVFQRFRRLGWIAAWQGDDRETYAAHPASKPDIERFFAACG